MKAAVINLTQHSQTQEQELAAQNEFRGGFVALADVDVADIREAITFDSLPSHEEMEKRAKELALIAKDKLGDRLYGGSFAMIGGAPYFQAYLEKALLCEGIIPVYAFSERVVKEVAQPDGSVTKTSVFQHAGWVYRHPTQINWVVEGKPSTRK